MTVSAIARQSEDKIMRQAYQRRKDEIYFNNPECAQDREIIEKQATEIEKQAAEIEKLRKEIEKFRAGKAI